MNQSCFKIKLISAFGYIMEPLINTEISLNSEMKKQDGFNISVSIIVV